jgi:hypothetical protein
MMEHHMLESYHSAGTAYQKAVTGNADTFHRRTGPCGVNQKTFQPNASDGSADVRTSSDLIEQVVPMYDLPRKIWTPRRSGRSSRLSLVVNREGIHKTPSASSADQWDRVYPQFIQVKAVLHPAAVLR